MYCFYPGEHFQSGIILEEKYFAKQLSQMILWTQTYCKYLSRLLTPLPRSLYFLSFSNNFTLNNHTLRETVLQKSDATFLEDTYHNLSSLPWFCKNSKCLIRSCLAKHLCKRHFYLHRENHFHFYCHTAFIFLHDHSNQT